MSVLVKFIGGKVNIFAPEQIKIINNKCYAPSGIYSMSLCEILFYEAE